MGEIKYRMMVDADIEQVAKIEKETFYAPWSKKAFYQELNENNIARYIVATKHDKIIAYGGMWFVLNEIHITNIAVASRYRRLGVGKGILCAMIEIAKDIETISGITLEVRRSNFAAQSLYRKYGFLVAGVRERYYDDTHEDAYIMWKKIR